MSRRGHRSGHSHSQHATDRPRHKPMGYELVVSDGVQMTNKHTPGPWHTSPDSSLHRIGVYAGGKEEIIICDVTGEDLAKDLELEANAMLIAAAPELLAALKAFLRSACRPGDDGKYDDSYDAAKGLCRAAIAKAEGLNLLAGKGADGGS